MPSREELMKIRSSLKFTWEAFFSRFGSFTPIQERAIPVILSGQDCLLSSRTASGKTEAVAAPLIERLKREKWKGFSTLYISPTRALVNDLFRRLEPRLDQIDITIRPRTADSPHLNIAKPPSLIITTPESFDGLLARTPRLFINVRAVILDEIHLLDGTPRGDQVRLLLHRLRVLRESAWAKGDAAASPDIQTVALSATVPEPEAVASRYCINPVVVKAEGKRSINAELRPMRSKKDLLEVISTFGQRGVRKALVFCASRVECEELAAFLKRAESTESKRFINPFGDNIFAHHSSLERKVRLDVEERFAQGQAGICFATSTLELGVDIGDIDIVILVGAPFSISSFLQRIGRGNRRTNLTNVLGFYRSSFEFHIFSLLLKAAKDGEQDEAIYSFRPSVVVQQILSYLKQNGMLDSNSTGFLLEEPSTKKKLMTASEENALIEHLVNEDVLKRGLRGGELTQGEEGRKLYEKHQENSNIEPSGGVTVVDDLTGRVIGEIQDSRIRAKDSFPFGANILDVVRIEKGRVNVNIDNDKEANKQLRFYSIAAPLPYSLACKLRDIAGIAEDELPAFEYNGAWVLVHAIGTIYGMLLSELLSQSFGWKSRPNKVILKAAKEPPEVMIAIEEELVASLAKRKLDGLESHLRMGKFQNYLPRSLRERAVEAAVIPSRFCNAVNGCRISIVYEVERIARLREIIE